MKISLTPRGFYVRMNVQGSGCKTHQLDPTLLSPTLGRGDNSFHSGTLCAIARFISSGHPLCKTRACSCLSTLNRSISCPINPPRGQLRRNPPLPRDSLLECYRCIACPLTTQFNPTPFADLTMPHIWKYVCERARFFVGASSAALALSVFASVSQAQWVPQQQAQPQPSFGQTQPIANY